MTSLIAKFLPNKLRTHSLSFHPHSIESDKTLRNQKDNEQAGKSVLNILGNEKQSRLSNSVFSIQAHATRFWERKMKGKIPEAGQWKETPWFECFVEIAGKLGKLHKEEQEMELLICNNHFVRTSSLIKLNKYLSGPLKEDGMYTPGSIVITCAQINRDSVELELQNVTF